MIDVEYMRGKKISSIVGAFTIRLGYDGSIYIQNVHGEHVFNEWKEVLHNNIYIDKGHIDEMLEIFDEVTANKGNKKYRVKTRRILNKDGSMIKFFSGEENQDSDNPIYMRKYSKGEKESHFDLMNPYDFFKLSLETICDFTYYLKRNGRRILTAGD